MVPSVIYRHPTRLLLVLEMLMECMASTHQDLVLLSSEDPNVGGLRRGELVKLE